MIYKYKPQNVCSKEMIFDIDDKKKIINSYKCIGGCPGNTLGIGALIKNMKVDDAIEKLRGIKCGNKQTSCPDQISIALTNYLNGK